MPLLLNLLVRLVLVVVGVCAALAIAAAATLLLAAWLLRAAWCKLTGRPVHPFVVRYGVGDVFTEVRRRAAANSSAPARRVPLGDVTDVEVKR